MQKPFLKNAHKILLITGFIFLLYAIFMTYKKKTTTIKIDNITQIEPIAYPLIIRKDSKGDGNFGAFRVAHPFTPHEGVDYQVVVGQQIYAPFTGKIDASVHYPYKNDNRYLGCLLKGTNGLEAKIFYVNPKNLGMNVSKGEVIGTAQNIASKYGSGMTNHVHLEVRKDNVLINPTTLIG